MKAARREFDGLHAVCLDAALRESPETIAKALAQELDAGTPRAEVGILRGHRLGLSLPERPALLLLRTRACLGPSGGWSPAGAAV